MLNYLDILDRAHRGPYISEENWDLEKIAMTAKRLVKKHKLEWDRNCLVTDDPALSEAIWNAGYELAVEVGAYSRTTELIIQISQEEIGNLSGVSRQRANQALQVLEKQGLLRVEYGGITVLDPEGLGKFGS